VTIGEIRVSFPSPRASEAHALQFLPIRGIRVIRGQKIQSFRKIFGNFVPNFRDWVANSKNYKLKTKAKRNDTHEHTNENTYVSTHL